MFRYFFGPVLLMLGIALGPGPAYAKTLNLSPAEMRLSAIKSMRVGRSDIALKIANALLLRSPSDLTALIIKSQAARNLGQFKIAIQAGKKGWEHSKTDLGHYSSALVTAQALASSGARTRAQFWLRRAAHSAPTEQDRKRAVQDFRYVKGRNPFSTSLRFSVQPSSNINNGSKSDTLIVAGLPFELSGDARALSGLEFSYGFSTTYKKQITPDRLIRFGFSADARNYVLSEKSKEQAPDQDASDYAFATAQLSFGTTKSMGQGRGDFLLDFHLGRSWYGGKSLNNFARITAARTFQKTRTSHSRYLISATRQWRLDASQYSSTQVEITGYWAKALQNGSLLRWNFGVKNTSSDSATIAQSSVHMGASLTPAKDILGARMTMSFGLEANRFKQPYFGILREDEKATLGVSLFFHQIDYYGFAPTLSISASRQRSNISLFDTTRFGISAGFRSTF